MCENMTHFGKVSITDRHEFQRNDNMNNDAGPYDMIVDNNINRRRQMVRKLDWKTERLVYNLYACYGLSMKRVSKLFCAGTALVHSIVYAWANMLGVTLEKFFPVPTRSQLLRSYPKSVIKNFGRANFLSCSTPLSWVPRLGRWSQPT